MIIREAENEIGSLVEYRDDPIRDYGLISSVSPSTVFVRFHLGDTAQGCDPARLTLRVHAAVSS